ncbi:hypothetical protein H2248_011687 [Termitomyces sp. 'cryptogamus']|nr:hypothetical protein H2248_011687 [Termitomyces sp. 'cryptogamus']
MTHSPIFRATSTRYIAIPPSFFAHASPAGQSTRFSKSFSGKPVVPPPTKMSSASQQAARLAQQRVTKQKETMTKGTSSTRASSSTRVCWTTSSSSTSSPSPSSHTSTSSTRSDSSSISSFSSLGTQEISQAVQTLRNMEDRLDDILSKFRMPDHLDFISTHMHPPYLYYYSRNGPLTHLSFTTRNSPVIALGNLLNSLEQELGFLEVDGNNCIEARKNNIANRIKETMANLEKRVHDLWWAALSKQASTAHLGPTIAVPDIPSDPSQRENL